MAIKDIGQKYQLLDEIEHVLKRPGMYIGSTKPHTSNEWILGDGGFFEKEELTYNPGFLKLFDEIISNSVDEHKRSGKINIIKVQADAATVSVWDNGGIPVVQHPEHKVWIPELIFANLRAGSNFDDTEGRTVAGTNGVGASLVNIFSDRFIVDTADGKNRFYQTFVNHMADRTKAKISKSTQGFTEITYTPDLSQFGMASIDDAHIKMMRKRVIEIAAANPGLKVEFGKEKFRFKTFKEYVDLFVKDAIWEKSEHWDFAIGVSKDGYQSQSFVNSILTKDGGTHENYIIYQTIEHLRGLIKKKYKVDTKPAEIRNHMFLFLNCTVINPSFSAQTKEKLITEPKDFQTAHKVSEKFAKAIFTSEVVQSLLDWIEQKKTAEEKAELRKLNKSLSTAKVLKLIDAKGRDREKCSLGIFEGMSALSAVRKFRDPQTFGAFPLRGKFLNVAELKPAEIIKNEEVVQLMASLGIKLGEDARHPRYGKILIYTDADPDGDSIAGMLINFLARYWPELFAHERVFKVMTPLVVAKKGKDVMPFYSNEDYQKWETKTGARGWNVEYKKGLAALEDEEYKEIIHNPVLVKLDNDGEYKESLDNWFGNDSSIRKEKLLKLSI